MWEKKKLPTGKSMCPPFVQHTKKIFMYFWIHAMPCCMDASVIQKIVMQCCARSQQEIA